MPRIREAVFNDFENIKKLQERYSLEIKNYEQWRHLWEDNPVIKGIAKSWPIGWVLEDNNRQIVGYLGNIPFSYEFKGKRLIAAAATSFVVDVNHRNSSILLAKNFFTQENADLFLSTTANYEAGRVYSAFKVQKLPIGTYDISLFWITDYKKFISFAFVKKILPFIKKTLSLNNIIKLPLSLTIKGAAKLLGEIKCYPAFDGRFDVFWDNLKKRYYDRLLYVRGREQLDWHFEDAIIHKSIWIFVFERNSRIISYAIFLRQDDHKTGLKRMRLVDFQTIDDNPDILRGMISCGIKRCRREGMAVLEIIGFNPPKRNIVETCSPHKIKLLSWPFFYKAKDESLAEELKNPEAWDPCLLDGDASI